MSPTNLNLTSLAANAVAPISGNTYQIENLGFAHWLDNSGANTTDDNPVVAENAKSPVPTDMLWTYLTYPSSSGDTVFTLQSVSTIQSTTPGVQIGGRGGYVRVDTNTNKLVHGGQPMACILTQVAPSIFKMSPFDDVISEDGRLVATDITSACCSTANQVVLQQDVASLQQFWTFN